MRNATDASSIKVYMEMNRKAVWVSATLFAVGVTAAAVAVVRRGKRPTPERVLNTCLRAVDELESRIRSQVKEMVA